MEMRPNDKEIKVTLKGETASLSDLTIHQLQLFLLLYSSVSFLCGSRDKIISLIPLKATRGHQQHETYSLRYSIQ